MSLSPVSLGSSSKVYFRGENDDLFNAPGKFVAAQEGNDSFESSSNVNPETSKKGGFLKTTGKILGTAVLLLGASFGMYKWKGKWMLPENKGIVAWIKKAVLKPGEILDNKVVKPLGEKISNLKKPKITDAE